MTYTHRPRFLASLRLAGILTLLGPVNSAIAQSPASSSASSAVASMEQGQSFEIVPPPAETTSVNLQHFTRTPKNLFVFLGDHSQSSQYSRYIINGQWEKLKDSLFKLLTPEKSTQIYRSIVNALVESAKKTPPSQRLLTYNDVIGLSDIAPEPLSNQDVQQLGSLCRAIAQSGAASEELLTLLKKESVYFGKSSYSRKKNTALLLASAGMISSANEYLPSIQEAKSKHDYSTLNIHLTTSIPKARSSEEIQSVWKLNEWTLAQKDLPDSLRSSFQDHTITLLSSISEATRKEWLITTAKKNPASLNSLFKRFYNNTNAAVSQKDLPAIEKQLKTWNSVFKTSTSIPKFATSIYLPWKEIATSFSLVWIEETSRAFAGIKKNRALSRGRKPVVDYLNIGQLLKYDPITPELLSLVGHDVAHKLRTNRINLFIVSGKTDQAIKDISVMATYAPNKARKLAEVALVAWAKQANPQPENKNARRFPSTQGKIPLTSIRQARNIEKLAQLYKEIKAMKIGDVSDQSIVRAFAFCHSMVETYKLKDIEAVFGPVSKMPTSRIAALSKNMTRNLTTAWADEKMQKRYNTGRSAAELKESLKAGYNLQLNILKQSLKRQANYRIRVLLGDTYFTRAQFILMQIAKNNPQYRKDDPLELVQKALESYELAVTDYQNALKKEIPENYDITPFVRWFDTLVTSYASGGELNLDNLESWGFDRLRAKLLATPFPKVHIDLFAKQMEESIKSGSPEVKKARVDAILLVLKDSPSADFARQHREYYSELVKEIKLHAELLPASPTSKDMGIFISIRHTNKISRECRGFYHFLAAKKSSGGNLRRVEFAQSIKRALSKQFEVKSITYAPEGTRPRPLISNGTAVKDWSETPLAYVYLVKNSPEADQISTFALNLPFTDFSGGVIIPFNSNVIPLSPTVSTTKPKTPDNLRIFQTLNERTRDKNTVSLEIRAISNGIIPPIDEILDLSFKDFKVVSLVDEEMQVNKLVLRDQTNPSDHPETERNWTIKLSLPDFSPEKPTEFHFPTPKDASVPVEYHRYVDADLAKVGPVISFDAKEMESQNSWVWWLLLIPVLGLGLWFFFFKKFKASEATEEKTMYSLPESLNAFTCAALLMTIRKDGVIEDSKKQKELDADIQKVEVAGFAAEGVSKIDLKKISQKWIKLAN